MSKPKKSSKKSIQDDKHKDWVKEVLKRVRAPKKGANDKDD